MGVTVDAELRDYLKSILDVASEGKEFGRKAEAGVAELARRTGRIERTIYGASLPPPSEDEPTRPVTRSAPDIAINGAHEPDPVPSPAGAAIAVLGRLEAVESELRAQSRHMGIGARGWRYMRSREGRKDLRSWAILLLILYSALTGRPIVPAQLIPSGLPAAAGSR